MELCSGKDLEVIQLHFPTKTKTNINQSFIPDHSSLQIQKVELIHCPHSVRINSLWLEAFMGSHQPPGILQRRQKIGGKMMLPSYYPTKSVFSLTIFSFITILKEYLTLQEICPVFEHLKNTNKITKLIHYREQREFFFHFKKSKNKSLKTK